MRHGAASPRERLADLPTFIPKRMHVETQSQILQHVAQGPLMNFS
jgi:hypothetical protein